MEVTNSSDSSLGSSQDNGNHSSSVEAGAYPKREQLHVRPIVTDEGWAWAVVFSASVIGFLAGGTIVCQGVFFVNYLDLFDGGTVATSNIGFAFGITMVVISPIGGYLADKLSHKQLRIVECVTFTSSAACVALAAFMPTLDLTIVFFGLLGATVGIGVPISFSFVSSYFVKRLTLAISIAVIGGNVGGMVLPFLFSGLADYCAFRGAMLIFAAIWLHALLQPVLAWPLSKKNDTHSGTQLEISTVSETIDKESNREEVEEKKSQDKTDVQNSTSSKKSKSVWKEIFGIFINYGKFIMTPKVPLLLLSLWLGAFGSMGGYFLVPPLAKELGMTQIEASVVLTINSISDLVTKIIVGLLVDKLNVSKSVLLLVSYGVTASVVMVISFVQNTYTLYLHGLIVGSFGTIVTGLIVPLLADIVDVSQLGIAGGMFPVLIGLASSLSPVIYGAVQTASGSYQRSLQAQSLAYLLGILFYFANPSTIKIKSVLHSKTLKIKANQ